MSIINKQANLSKLNDNQPKPKQESIRKSRVSSMKDTILNTFKSSKKKFKFKNKNFYYK